MSNATPAPAFLAGKRILVTGGTGFVGRHLVPLLLEAGAAVTVITRSTSKTSHLPAGTRFLQASLATGEGLAQAFGEADLVVHMAALLFGLGWQDYLKANCRAAQCLASAFREARRQGKAPSRVVFVSSMAGAGPSASPQGRSEKEPAAPVSAYGWSKLVSENILKAGIGDSLVVLRPPIIYGSGDLGLLPVYQGLQRGVAACPGLARDFPVAAIHVDDMARAVLLALSPEASGTYHLGDGRAYPMAEFYREAARALGTQARIVRLPLWFMGATAALATAFGMLVRLFRKGGRAPNWNLDKYREAREEGWTADCSRIREELGFAPTVSLEEGFRETMEGNYALGLLKDRRKGRQKGRR